MTGKSTLCSLDMSTEGPLITTAETSAVTTYNVSTSPASAEETTPSQTTASAILETVRVGTVLEANPVVVVAEPL